MSNVTASQGQAVTSVSGGGASGTVDAVTGDYNFISDPQFPEPFTALPVTGAPGLGVFVPVTTTSVVTGVNPVTTGTSSFLTSLDVNFTQVVASLNKDYGGASTNGAAGAFACGPGARAAGDYANAFGTNAWAAGNGATGLGAFAQAFGPVATAAGYAATAAGPGATATGARSDALGLRATATGYDATAIGTDATATGANSFAWGTGASATGAYAAAVGPFATASGYSASAFGPGATASGAFSVAAGLDATATGSGAVAGGINVTATGSDALAVGVNSTATGASAVAAGINTTATGAGAVATGDGATAVGANAEATFKNSAAFGAGAQATAAGEQVFGRGGEVSDGGNTYTMGGITSNDSRARQSGPLQLVTTDAAGHLAADGGAVFDAIARAQAGIAIGIAMEAPSLTERENFGIRLGYGNFDGDANAIGMSAMGVICRDCFNQGSGDRIALDVGLGLGWSDFQGYDSRTVSAGRAGVQWTWK